MSKFKVGDEVKWNDGKHHHDDKRIDIITAIISDDPDSRYTRYNTREINNPAGTKPKIGLAYEAYLVIHKEVKQMCEYDKNLKPCPFCGGKSKVKGYKNAGNEVRFKAYCTECLIENSNWGEHQGAVQYWNRRKGVKKCSEKELI